MAARIALVTGGSRGIGRAIALALAELGVDVLVTYVRRREAALAVVDELVAKGVQAAAFRVDVSRADEIERLFDEVAAHAGGLDIYVHNAVSATIRPLAELPDRHFMHMLEANLVSLLRAGKRAAALMEGRRGHIVAVSSIGSRLHVPGYGALGVAKAGIEALVRALAVEWAERGINVNAVCGGIVDTAALDAFDKGGVDRTRLAAAMAARTPEGRLGTPEDLARVVAMLCTPACDWIRGQTIVVDGGMSSVAWLGERK